MILGLTGAFGGGKSTVLDYFSKNGWFVFDADAACHRIYDTADAGLMAGIADIFGAAAISPDGKIDRREIAKQGFQDRSLLTRLTGLIYPRLTGYMQDEISRCRLNGEHGIFELPLLYEGGFEKNFDAVLAVWTSPEIRRQRLEQRHFTPDDMARRDAGQLDPVLKLERADAAVVNNGSCEMLYRQLDLLLSRWSVIDKQ